MAISNVKKSYLVGIQAELLDHSDRLGRKRFVDLK